ncbi:ABC transporter substrate-binding protein [Lachnospiraceae bacterium NSJ-143]|nr:ABC transporter substrate-binding protein [Lachnospiraceae bacterium NSJ-143]
MGKRLRTAVTSVLALAMAAVMAGCSSSGSASGTGASSAGASASSQEESKATAESGTIKIGIIQLLEHDALDSAREGFVKTLNENGYIDGQNIIIDYQNAQNDQSNLKTISQRFVQEEDDLILAIATGAAQSVAAETSDIPILGTAITDYEAAQLVDSSEAPGGNVSGTTDLNPVDKQLALLKEMLPEAKTLGILYNSSEVNSEIQAQMAQAAAEALGLECKTATVTNTNDIAQVMESIAGDVDAIYIPTDNTFASAMATVSKVAEEYRVPTICGESGMVKSGGLATVGIDYYKLGCQTAEMAIRILRDGEDVSKMPIEGLEDTDVCINLDEAQNIEYEFPQSVIDKATITVKDGEVIQK